MTLKKWLGMEINEVDREEKGAVIRLHVEKIGRLSLDLRELYLCNDPFIKIDKRVVFSILSGLEEETHRIKQLLNL